MCVWQEYCQDPWCNSPLSLWIRLNLVTSVHLPRLVWNVIVVILQFLLLSMCGLWKLSHSSFLAWAQVLYCMVGALLIDMAPSFPRNITGTPGSLKVDTKLHKHLCSTSTPAHTRTPALHDSLASQPRGCTTSFSPFGTWRTRPPASPSSHWNLSGFIAEATDRKTPGVRHSTVPHFLRVTKCWLMLWLKIIMCFPSLKGRKCHNFTFLFGKTCALASLGWFSGKATSDWGWVISPTFQLPKPHRHPPVAEAVVQWLSVMLVSPRRVLEFFMAVLTHLTHQSVPRELMVNTEVYKDKAM